ncbi:MAG: hypothetical protein EP330_01855 [Deltaproteobacteria bacterium]|nr:MAG: hypothetical protein EP330_01855 [Deltaproteobacteria bacterium]
MPLLALCLTACPDPGLPAPGPTSTISDFSVTSCTSGRDAFFGPVSDEAGWVGWSVRMAGAQAVTLTSLRYDLVQATEIVGDQALTCEAHRAHRLAVWVQDVTDPAATPPTDAWFVDVPTSATSYANDTVNPFAIDLDGSGLVAEPGQTIAAALYSDKEVGEMNFTGQIPVRMACVSTCDASPGTSSFWSPGASTDWAWETLGSHGSGDVQWVVSGAP